MRVLLVLLPLAGCVGNPDRWNAGVSRGAGELEGPQNDWETAETRLEIGVSGPIGTPRATTPRPPEPYPMPKAPPALPLDESPIPWELIIGVAAGAAGLKGSEAGYRRMRKKKPT